MHLPKPQIIDPGSVPSLPWGSSTQDLYGDLLTPKSKFLTIELLQDHVPMA